MHYIKVAILPALFLLGCEPKTVGEILAKSKSEKSQQAKEVENLKVTVRQFSKTHFLLSRAHLDGHRAITEALIDSLESEFGYCGTMFLLRIEPKDSSGKSGMDDDLIYGPIGGFSDYRSAMQEYQFGLKEKIWLESSKEKIPLSGYQMENTFGFDHGRTFIIQFPDLKKGSTGNEYKYFLVLDDIVPGLGRWKTEWLILNGKI
jgi:hypothetical protein